jgi:hypothetical protein
METIINNNNNDKGTRNFFIYTGIIAAFILNRLPIDFALYIFLSIIALLFTLYGCLIWTRIKNRHCLFTLWGILAPKR